MPLSGVNAGNMVSVIAKNIRNRRDHKTLCDIFDKVDLSGNGTISIAEYVRMCQSYGIHLCEEDLELVRALANCEGEIQKNAFIQHIKEMRLLDDLKQDDPASDLHWQKICVIAFRIFDSNEDGFITKKEFRWMTSSSLVTHDIINCVFQRYDEDANGKLDFAEFSRMIESHRARKELIALQDEEEARSSWKKRYELAKKKTFKKSRPQNK